MKTQKNRLGLLVSVTLVLLLIMAGIWLTPAIARNNKAKNEKAVSKAEKVIVIDEDGTRTTYNADELPSPIRKTIEGATESGGRTTSAILGLADAMLTDLNISGLTREVTRTIAEVRLSDFTAEIDRAIADIDWEGVNMEVDRTLQDIHYELNNPELRKDIRSRLTEAQDELAMAANGMGHDISAAREELIAARQELASARKSEIGSRESHGVDTGFEAMLLEMETDRLIDKTEGYEVRKSGNELIINGKSQSDKVYNKYNKFLKGKDVTITGDQDGTVIKLK